MHPVRRAGGAGVEGGVCEGEVDGGGDADAVEEGDGGEEGQLEVVGHGGGVQFRLHLLVEAHRVVTRAVGSRRGDERQQCDKQRGEVPVGGLHLVIWRPFCK